MIEHKLDVINLIESIIENGQNWDSEIKSFAKKYVEILQSFDFNFCIELFSIILLQTMIIFEILQNLFLIFLIAQKILTVLLFIQ
jgi:hypothetical protein